MAIEQTTEVPLKSLVSYHSVRRTRVLGLQMPYTQFFGMPMKNRLY